MTKWELRNTNIRRLAEQHQVIATYLASAEGQARLQEAGISYLKSSTAPESHQAHDACGGQ